MTRLRMLVVDDEPTVCEAIQAGLEEYCGATVVCCATGTATVAILENERVDVAVIDVELSSTSGFDLAERAANVNVPVLLTPGHPGTIEICRRYRYPHLPKPFLPSLLAERAIDIIRSAQQNLDRVRAATATRKGASANLSDALNEAKRTLSQTTAIMSRLQRTSPSSFV